MVINAKFDRRVVVHSAQMNWVNSPMTGVVRRPLDRVGDEIARATSIVKYAPGSHFSAHVHTGGEEFLVLEGVFQDEHGDFPAGSYVRNPPQSSHTPGSKEGCVIFVKLWQFDLGDRQHVHLNIDHTETQTHLTQAGVTERALYSDKHEQVSVQHWHANCDVEFAFPEGAEILVLDGCFKEGVDVLTKHSWLRLPLRTHFKATAGENGAKIWIKTGHLNRVASEVERLPN